MEWLLKDMQHEITINEDAVKTTHYHLSYKPKKTAER